MSVVRAHLGDDLLWGIPALIWAWIFQPILWLVVFALWNDDLWAGLFVLILGPLLLSSNTAWWGWSQLAGARTRWGRAAGGGVMVAAFVAAALMGWLCLTELEGWGPGAAALVSLGVGAFAALAGLGLPGAPRGEEEVLARRRAVLGVGVAGSMLLPMLWLGRALLWEEFLAWEWMAWGVVIAGSVTVAPAVAAHSVVLASRGGAQIGAMTRHMLAAAAVNLWRAPTYARMSRGRSLPASALMIGSELALVIVALGLDAWAWVYQLRGVDVLGRALMPMRPLPAPGPPRFARAVGPGARARQRALVVGWLSETRGGLEPARLEATIRATRELLGRIHQLERDEQVSWPMTRHLIESVGWALVHLRQDREVGERGTWPLVWVYVASHRLALRSAWVVDAATQRAHVHRAGILERDLPEIPFEAAPPTCD